MSSRGPSRRTAAGRRGGVVTAVLVLTSLSLLSLDLRAAPSPLGGARSALAEALGPVEEQIDALAAPFSGSQRLTDERIRALQAEIDRLTLENQGSALDQARLHELDDLLRLTGAGHYATVPALVIAVAPAQTAERTVTIDAGTADGVEADMTVLNGDGLVGRVVAAARSTATVQLLIDPTTQLGARLEGSLELGIARGDGSALGFELLDPLAPMAAGDRVVTYGSPDGSPYVAGVPVGELIRVSGEVGAATRIGMLEPYVDFSALDLVGVVVQPPRTDPRDAVLPPRTDPRDAVLPPRTDPDDVVLPPVPTSS